MSITDDSERRGVSLHEDIATALKDTRRHDVTFVCSDGSKISATRWLLAARSNYFNVMFFGNMLESTAKEIPLKNTTQHQLSAVIEFCYTDKIPSLSLETAADLHKAADYFQLEGMRDVVAEYVKQNLGITLKDRDTAISMLCHAVDEKQQDFINGNIAKVLRSCILSHRVGKEQLRLFTPEALEALLSDRELTKNCPTRAFPLFLAIVEWAWDTVEAGGEPLETDRQSFFSWLRMTIAEANATGMFMILKESDHERLRTILNPIMDNIEFKNICPHRLAVIMDALPFLPLKVLCQAFRAHSLKNKHQDEWCTGNALTWCPARFNNGITFKDDNSTAEYAETTDVGVKLIHTNPLPTTGIFDYTIAIRSIGGTPANEAMASRFAVGLVQKSKIIDGTATVGTFIGSCGYLITGYTFQNGQRATITSSTFTAGAQIKFSLNREARTCTVYLNDSRQVQWPSLPDDILPAVSLTPGTICEIW